MTTKTSPAHLFTPDPAGEQVFASDEHRRILGRCRPGIGIAFTQLVDVLSRDPFTYGVNAGDEAKVGAILSHLQSDGDVTQNAHGVWEATPEGWERLTNINANEAAK